NLRQGSAAVLPRSRRRDASARQARARLQEAVRGVGCGGLPRTAPRDARQRRTPERDLLQPPLAAQAGASPALVRAERVLLKLQAARRGRSCPWGRTRSRRGRQTRGTNRASGGLMLDEFERGRAALLAELAECAELGRDVGAQ